MSSTVHGSSSSSSSSSRTYSRLASSSSSHFSNSHWLSCPCVCPSVCACAFQPTTCSISVGQFLILGASSSSSGEELKMTTLILASSSSPRKLISPRAAWIMNRLNDLTSNFIFTCLNWNWNWSVSGRIFFLEKQNKKKLDNLFWQWKFFFGFRLQLYAQMNMQPANLVTKWELTDWHHSDLPHSSLCFLLF